MTTLIQIQKKLPEFIKPQERIGYGLIIAWVVLMIAMPWLQFFFGDAIIPTAIVLAALLQASTVFYFVQLHWGLVRASVTFVTVAVLTWGAEFIGHTTNFPFGGYAYTDALQPQIAGVPLLIPVAWFMLLPSAWVMAQLIIGERDSLTKWLLFIGMSAVALTVWDLFLDPQMVAWDFWVWDNPSGYFGIPYMNYFGWLLVAAIVTAVIRPPELEVTPYVVIYAIVWFLQLVGQGIIWQQIGPAIVGGVAMGAVMFLAYWRNRKQLT